MYLKHLALQGYKSFADKIEFEFPPGITAIVGPNGSGKSNIADAIRWALGERSMSTLRAKSTADMIFAGGQNRARAGMAEVALTFDNADGTLPIEFSEVTIARRAYRSGENEYLINGSQVLLRDINELLAESGLSDRTYTIIGQGLVDAALALRPIERRALFEEAAGISLHRDRRETTVERLDETERNLERVHDIIAEVEPRLERLRRDAREVQEHRRLTAHLERLQRTWYGYQWGRKQAALERAQETVSNLAAQLEKRRSEVTALTEDVKDLRQQEGELRSDLRDWYRQSADLHDQADEAQRELAVSEERGRLLEARREELMEEIEPLRERREAQAIQVSEAEEDVAALEQNLVEGRAELESVETEWRQIQRRLQEREDQYTRQDRELHTLRDQLEEVDQALIEAREEISHLSGERGVAQERARQFEARCDEVIDELQPLRAREEKQEREVAQARAHVEALERELEQHRDHLDTLKREWEAAQSQESVPDEARLRVVNLLQKQRTRIEQLTRSIREAQGEEAQLAGELKALERMYDSGTAYDAGARALLQAGLDGVVGEGPLATLIQVPSAWEQAVEAVLDLSKDLQAIVIDRLSLTESARSILEAEGGRLTLLPLDTLRSPPDLPGEALCAGDVVTCDTGVRPAVEAILGRVVLCENLAQARALLPELPAGVCCVTAHGLVLRSDGALVIGEVDDDGLLADERARRELPARLEAVRRRLRDLEQERTAARDRVASLEEDLERIDHEATVAREERARRYQEQLGEARTTVAVTEETLRSQRAALGREEETLAQLRAQQARMQQQADALRDKYAAAVERARALRLAVSGTEDGAAPEGDGRTDGPVLDVARDFRARWEKAHRRRQSLEAQRRQVNDAIGNLERQLERLSREVAEAREEAARFEREVLAEARTTVAVTEETLRSRRNTLERERSLLEQLHSQVDARCERADELRAERAALAERVAVLREEATRLEEELRRIRVRIRPAEEELERLNEKQSALEERLGQAQARVREAEERHGRARLEVERRQDDLQMLARRIDEDLGLVEIELAENVTAQTPLPLHPLVSELPVVEDLPEGLEEELRFLKTRLRRLGSVNPHAPDELADVEERYQFLTEQAADLETASARLRQGVAELDALMERAFQETFRAVAGEFTEKFTDLFGGGEARLELTEPDDLLSSGVEIVARPPGKRAQRLAMLSGGERALTAAALLFSLLHVSPTPFCVLDEVDAMLDEANVGRFRAQLEALARGSQFIVITHNRGTVESADTIYGVSMGSNAVSQVVSLKLRDSKMQAYVGV